MRVPAPYLTKEKKIKIKIKIMFLRILSIINRVFSLVYKANSMENVLVWKYERLKDMCQHVEGLNLRSFEIIIFFFNETKLIS
jgi:hypothetical protein